MSVSETMLAAAKLDRQAAKVNASVSCCLLGAAAVDSTEAGEALVRPAICDAGVGNV
jgi:hypothetical protein